MSKSRFETADALLQELEDNNPSPTEADALALEDAKKNSFTYKEYTKDLIVKRFNAHSYRGPSLQDFITRADMIYQVLWRRLENQSQDSAAFQEKLNRLDQAKQACITQLQDNCDIQPMSAFERKEKARYRELKSKIEQAILIIQELLFEGLMLATPDAFDSYGTLMTALKEAFEEESRLIAEKGRPDFVNFYANPVANSEGEFVSVQRTIGHTIPSTERDNRFSPGQLPNFVECGVYYKDEKGGEPQKEFTGYRHSSYTPIRIENTYHRQKAAIDIAKSMLTELARQELLKKNNKEPIILNLSSLALLTPYRRIDMGIAKAEREYPQLAESYDALMFYNGRETTLKIDGKDVRVKLNATIMNAPNNPPGVQFSRKRLTPFKMVHSKLEEDINAQGMSQFIQKGCAFLNTLSTEGSGLVSSLSNIFDEDPKEKKLRFDLNQQYLWLESSLNESNPQDYFECKTQIAKINQKIFQIERARIKACRELLKQERPKIVKFLNELKNKENKSEQDQVAELFFETLLMYFDAKVEPIQYGARFLLASQKMGEHVDFYCKSGEDRTGRMQNMIEELCIFYRNFGHYPHYDAHKKVMDPVDQHTQSQIAVTVHDFSVSNDITGENSKGARGLQIGESLKANKSLPARVGDLMGKMAKGVYSLRYAGLWNELRKKIYGLRVDTARQHLLKKTQDKTQDRALGKNKRSSLPSQESTSGFSRRLIPFSERENYEQGRAAPRAISALPEAADLGHRLEAGDLLVIEKKYGHGVVGRIEKDAHMVRDMTKVPRGGLKPEVDNELAIEHAFAMVMPPFDPQKSRLILSGTDVQQVARIHAVLLFLQTQDPRLQALEVTVDDVQAKPEPFTDENSKKQNNQKFMDQYLNPEMRQKISDKLSEIKNIQKQQGIKSSLHQGRSQAMVVDIEPSETTALLKKI